MNQERQAACEIDPIDLDPNNTYVPKKSRRAANPVELTFEELEQRIAPDATTIGGGFFRLALNHNETLIADDV